MVVDTFIEFFLGIFGIHRFYVGGIGNGLLQLIIIGGFGIWALMDIIVIAKGDFKDIDGFRIKKY